MKTNEVNVTDNNKDGTHYASSTTTTATFYPDADPESTSVDGDVWESTSQSWVDLVADVGSGYGDSANAIVSAYDPLANENMRPIFPDVKYCTSAEEALINADACLVVTEWDEFKKLNHEFDVMEKKVVIDGRKVILPREEIDYEGLCW